MVFPEDQVYVLPQGVSKASAGGWLDGTDERRRLVRLDDVDVWEELKGIAADGGGFQ